MISITKFKNGKYNLTWGKEDGERKGLKFIVDEVIHGCYD